MTRDFSFAVLDVSVAYGEDTDRVTEVLREIAAEIRPDPKLGPVIRDDIEIMGVERLGDSGVVIRARVKADPPRAGRSGGSSTAASSSASTKLGHRDPLPAHQKLVIEREARTPPMRTSPRPPRRLGWVRDTLRITTDRISRPGRLTCAPRGGGARPGACRSVTPIRSLPRCRSPGPWIARTSRLSRRASPSPPTPSQACSPACWNPSRSET
jgi:hypothetical protein